MRQSVCLCAVVLLFATGATQAAVAPVDPIAGLVASAKPAIVTITTYDADGKEDGQGTGFLVDESHVVTCYHVIEGSTKARIKTATGHTCEVKGIAASDQIADVVRLSLTGPVKGAKCLSLSKSLPKQGERVVVLGTPLGLEITASDGIVSAIRDIPGISKVIQITAPISPGSSGSPVLNFKGEVVGVVTSCLVGGQNLNFAVASELVLSLKPSPSALVGTPHSVAEQKAWNELRAAFDCLFQGDRANALVHSEEATRLQPNDALAWGIRSWCHLELKQFSSAVDALKQAIRIKPDDALSHRSLGGAYFELRRFQEARDAYKEAIRIKPDDALSHFLLGITYMILGNKGSALDEYRILKDLDTERANSLFNLIYK